MTQQHQTPDERSAVLENILGDDDTDAPSDGSLYGDLRAKGVLADFEAHESDIEH